MKKRRKVRPLTRKRVSNKTKQSNKLFITVIGLIALSIGLVIGLLANQSRTSLHSIAAPAPELLTDRQNLSFTSGAYTSTYHVFATGLDYSKSVGLMVFSDGTGESGISRPTSTYQMGGPTGLIAVAKKHNMVLVTPFSPNRSCKCWDEGDRTGYAQWAEALITQIESQYQIDKKRVAFGGYSSGATLTGLSWIPTGAAQRTMDAGVLIMISLGGSGRSSTAYTPAFKSNVHLYWNIGDQDEFLEQAQEGYQSYTSEGFQTAIDIIPGKSHNDRNGEFGPIFDAQISKYIPVTAAGAVPPGTTSPSGAAQPIAPSPAPTFFCGGSIACVPTGTAGSTTPGAVQTTPSANNNPSNPPVASGIPVSAEEPTQAVINIPSQNPAIPAQGGGEQKGLFAKIIALILQFIVAILALFN